MRFHDRIWRPKVSRVQRQLAHSPERLYHILIDFLEHHRRIVPHSVSVGSYQVLAGGVGHGTVIAFASTLHRDGHPLRYRVSVTEPGTAFEIVSDDGMQRQQFHVAEGETADSAIVTLSWRSGPVSGPGDLVRAWIAHHRATRMLEEKMDNLDRYAATLGNLVPHAGGYSPDLV